MAKDTIIIGGQEFPTSCPEKCPANSVSFDRLCYRCPIFNCAPDSNGFSLLEADDYRPDWAKAWKEWFEGDMKEWPELYLERRKEDE